MPVLRHLPRVSGLSAWLVVSVVLLASPASAQSVDADAFGRRDRGTGALIGIFYDLKQTQDRKPVPQAPGRYTPTLDRFLVDGLHESHLSGFFRAGLPLYTTQLYIPGMSADNAPKAFGVEGVVKPALWIIHYKGQIAPPESGTYRFVGGADDVLVVAINRKVVLVGNHPDTKFKTLNWLPPEQPTPKPALSNYATYGDWIELRADQPVDIDIILGERPGGSFNAALGWVKRGETYPADARGRPLIPLLQLAPHAGPANKPYLTDRPVWKILP